MGDYIGTKAFAEKYGCKQSTVSSWCRKDLIPGADHDGHGSPWRIPIDAVPPDTWRRKENI